MLPSLSGSLSTWRRTDTVSIYELACAFLSFHRSVVAHVAMEDPRQTRQRSDRVHKDQRCTGANDAKPFNGQRCDDQRHEDGCEVDYQDAGAFARGNPACVADVVENVQCARDQQ